MHSIRPAETRDIGAITSIYSHHVLNSAATFEVDPPDQVEMEERFQGVTSAGLPYLVAEVEGRVAGFAYAGRYRPRYAYRFTVEDSVYLDPAMVGRGIGGGLLDRLIELCALAGARQMVAVIGDSANVASIRLHARFGFRSVGVLEGVGLKFGRWVDTVLMQRALLG